MRAAIFLILVSSLLLIGCVKAPEKAIVEKPAAAAEPSLSQEIGTLDDADSGVNELDQLDSDANSIQI